MASNKTFTIDQNKTKVENIEHSLNTFIRYVHRINKKNNTVKIIEMKYNHCNSGVGVIYYLNNIEQRLKIKHEFYGDYFILSVMD